MDQSRTLRGEKSGLITTLTLNIQFLRRIIEGAVDMSTITSVESVLPSPLAPPWSRLATSFELLSVYAGILLYIWRWQSTHPHVWMVLLAVIIASHFIHHDTPRHLGLTLGDLRANAGLTLPLAVALLAPLVAYGFAAGALTLEWPGGRALEWFAEYGSWCVFQQYLLQSYFHNRLMSVLHHRHLSSLVAGVMFGAAHIPNPVLMAATTLGGFLLAETFARHRNIWPLALAQTVGGALIAAISPAAMIHNMRVGPGYFNYRG